MAERSTNDDDSAANVGSTSLVTNGATTTTIDNKLKASVNDLTDFDKKAKKLFMNNEFIHGAIAKKIAACMLSATKTDYAEKLATNCKDDVQQHTAHVINAAAAAYDDVGVVKVKAADSSSETLETTADDDDEDVDDDGVEDEDDENEETAKKEADEIMLNSSKNSLSISDSDEEKEKRELDDEEERKRVVDDEEERKRVVDDEEEEKQEKHSEPAQIAETNEKFFHFSDEDSAASEDALSTSTSKYDDNVNSALNLSIEDECSNSSNANECSEQKQSPASMQNVSNSRSAELFSAASDNDDDDNGDEVNYLPANQSEYKEETEATKETIADDMQEDKIIAKTRLEDEIKAETEFQTLHEELEKHKTLKEEAMESMTRVDENGYDSNPDNDDDDDEYEQKAEEDDSKIDGVEVELKDNVEKNEQKVADYAEKQKDLKNENDQQRDFDNTKPTDSQLHMETLSFDAKADKELLEKQNNHKNNGHAVAEVFKINGDHLEQQQQQETNDVTDLCHDRRPSSSSSSRNSDYSESTNSEQDMQQSVASDAIGNDSSCMSIEEATEEQQNTTDTEDVSFRSLNATDESSLPADVEQTIKATNATCTYDAANEQEHSQKMVDFDSGIKSTTSMDCNTAADAAEVTEASTAVIRMSSCSSSPSLSETSDESSQALVIDQPVEETDTTLTLATQKTEQQQQQTNLLNCAHCHECFESTLDLTQHATQCPSAPATSNTCKSLQTNNNASLLNEVINNWQKDATMPTLANNKNRKAKSAMRRRIKKSKQSTMKTPTTPSPTVSPLCFDEQAFINMDDSFSQSPPSTITMSSATSTTAALTHVNSVESLNDSLSLTAISDMLPKTTSTTASILKVIKETRMENMCTTGKRVTQSFVYVRASLKAAAEQPTLLLCASCDTVHTNDYNFMHQLRMHRRIICIYCLLFFPNSERLCLHMENKHDLQQNHFSSEQALLQMVQSSDTKGYLLCCSCEHVFEQHECFATHVCDDYVLPCKECGQKGKHSNQCQAHPIAVRARRIRRKLKESEEAAAAAAAAAEEQLQQQKEQQQQQHIIDNCDMNRDVSIPMSPPTSPPQLLPTIETAIAMETTTAAQPATANTPPSSPIAMMTHDDMPNTQTTLPSVPKLMLRVPKVFQRIVDQPLSSSESDEVAGDEDDEEEDQQQQLTDEHMQQETITANISQHSTHSRSRSKSRNSSTDSSSTDSEQDSEQENNCCLEDAAQNSQQMEKMRLLQEAIDVTKMAIERTRQHNKKSEEEQETLAVQATEAAKETAQQEELLSQQTLEMVAPTTNTATMITNFEQNSAVTVLEKPIEKSPLQRKISVGSDDMDLDESINTEPNLLQQGVPMEDSSAQMETNCEKEDLPMQSDTGNDEQQQKEQEETSANTTFVNIEDDDEVHLPVQTEGILTNQQDNTTAEQNKATVELESKQEVPAEITEQPEAMQHVEPVPPPPATELYLQRALESYGMIELLRVCMLRMQLFCNYCNHARRIAVNAQSLLQHLLSEHRFKAEATSDAIGATLEPDVITAKLQSFLPELEMHFLNSKTYCSYNAPEHVQQSNERIFECLSCRYSTFVHKELYLHNRKEHQGKGIECAMCNLYFYTFSELLCHLCPGIANSSGVLEMKFRCCLCEYQQLPSAFRLMVHLRKQHCVCDICLDDCHNQSKLSSHVWKHKLAHICRRCGCFYRNKQDMTRHLFWKHGTESTFCKRCMIKRWPHVYHFCVPPHIFSCEICQLGFSKAVYLRVHRRIHTGDLRYACTEPDCEEKFISRGLLRKHLATHQTEEQQQQQQQQEQEKQAEQQEEKQQLENMNDEVVDAKPLDIKVEQSAEQTAEVAAKALEVEETAAAKAEVQEEQTDKLPQLSEEQKQTAAETGTPPTVAVKDETKETPVKKSKQKRRHKQSIDDFNLPELNLSEDSDDESAADSEEEEESHKSVKAPTSPTAAAPIVASNENSNADIAAAVDAVDKATATTNEEAAEEQTQMLEVWKTLLEAQQQQQQQQTQQEQTVVEQANYTENDYPTPRLHVSMSDHDYCKLHQPAVLAKLKKRTVTSPATDNNAAFEQQPRRRSSSCSSSSSSSSNTSSSSCDTDCSCCTSSSNSDSSSSNNNNNNNNNNENSDSSTAGSNTNRKRKERKKLQRRKSQSISPQKRHNSISRAGAVAAAAAVMAEDEKVDVLNTDEPIDALPAKAEEPLFHESDLDTAESDTDEEYYDVHPQKMMNDFLLQKRKEVYSNNELIENSRPSTPSLPPEEADAVAQFSRPKKRKRERRSSTKGRSSAAKQLQQTTDAATPTTPMMSNLQSWINSGSMSQQAAYPSSSKYYFEETPITPASSQSGGSETDAAALKRSKRARRPNRFYGYTSEDELMGSTPQPLMIGMRMYKPQPPPQLTWRKEDLPSPPSKKHKTSRTPKTALGMAGLANPLDINLSRKRKRRPLTAAQNARRNKRAMLDKPPPIPTLKIRTADIGLKHLCSEGAAAAAADEQEQSSDTSSVEDDELPQLHNSATPAWSAYNASLQAQAAARAANSSSALTADSLNSMMLQAKRAAAAAAAQAAASQLAATTNYNLNFAMPIKPTKPLPPALDPTPPDFNRMQYFRANNIRYPVRPPANARQPLKGEAVYCYCRCPYDEVSEMIACDGADCTIEWFHFECVGIMVAPLGKWYCAECRPQYSEQLYPHAAAAATTNNSSTTAATIVLN